MAWSKGDRPACELIDEVVAHVRAWGLPELSWAVSELTAPSGIEHVLIARGATLRESYRVLAYDFSAGLPQLEVPDDVVAELVSDEPRLRAAMLVNAAGLGQPAARRRRVRTRARADDPGAQHVVQFQSARLDR